MHRGIIVKSTFFSSIAFILVMTSFCEELHEETGDLEKRMREMEKTIKQIQEEKGDLEKRIIALICLLLPSSVIVISFLGKRIRELENKIKELQKQMGDLGDKRIKEAKEKMEELQKEMGKLANKIKELEKQMEEAKEKMEKLQKQKEELQKQMEELEKQMGDLGDKRIKEAKEKMEELQKQKEELQKQMEELEKQMGDLGDKRIKEPKEKMEELQKQMEELQKQMGDLEKRINETKKELEWRWARNNSDDITLHGVTAHPNLSISRDEKSFTHEAQPQRVPPNPERFDSTVCVLGAEGFSSGKHYWEVEVVSSNDWDLGVARKSIQRKGKLSLSPKEGFWALGLSGRDYWAKTDPWTRVNVQKKPKKIGVYLSYQEGQVTFFNVTDMSVLFTFNDCSFSGKVYPFFKNSHKETTMRICSIKEE